MYLVDIHTLELKEFIGTLAPPYAILSHRWGPEEINFRDLHKKRVDKNLRGYQKLVEACRVAATYKVDYLWMDTCCIDKKSSAELSEAINSMFAWYAKSKVCLAYLEDIQYDPDVSDSLQKSIWFTRSWTLQELIAPSCEVFYDASWHRLGDKVSQAAAIMARTGIPFIALTSSNPYAFRAYSIAERMSWASDREATRSEDIAYSLMGIFDVNMPLLYGEGDKAFLRLQEEIIKQATEYTFLVWGLEKKVTLSLLASSPADFRSVRGHGVVCHRRDDSLHSLTSTSLEINAPLIRYHLGIYGILMRVGPNIDYMVLIQKALNSDRYVRIGIARPNTYFPAWRMERVTLARRASTEDVSLMLTIFDESRPEKDCRLTIQSHDSLVILPYRYPEERLKQHTCTDLWAEARWDRDDQANLHCIFDDLAIPGLAIMEFQLPNSRSLWFEVSFDFYSRPCVRVSDSPGTMISYKAIKSPSVFELSDVVTEEPDVVQTRDDRRLVKMCELVDSSSGSLSYFLRSSQRSCFDATEIPSHLTTVQDPIWLAIVPPRYLRTDLSSGTANIKCYNYDWVLVLSSRNLFHM